MLMSLHWPTAARAWTWGRCFGRLSMSSWRKAMPMAPEEQRTTRWPSRRRPTAVSTIVERVLSRGSCVFSSTMDDVPVVEVLAGAVLRLASRPYFYIPSLITIVRWRFILVDVCVHNKH